MLKILITVSAILYSTVMIVLFCYYTENISNKEYTRYFLSEDNGNLFKIISNKSGRIISICYLSEYTQTWRTVYGTRIYSNYKQYVEYYNLKYICKYRAEELIKHRLVMKELEA